jgi:hypothetical protein
LYFQTGGVLQETPGTNLTSNLVNNVTTGFTMQNAVNDEFKGANFTNNFKKASLTFN